MNGGHLDAVVIGAGMAGLPLALKLGAARRTVALIERGDIGGTCLNRGCIPSKTMIESANVAHRARTADRWGIDVGAVRSDMRAVVTRKDGLVESIRRGAERTVARSSGVTRIRGHAYFTSDRVLEVDGRRLTAERVFVNTGARPHVPSIDGLRDVPYLDSTSIMELRHLPEHLIVVGGGFVGVEFGQAFHRFGSRVTIVQQAPHLLPDEDADVSQALLRALREEGLGIDVATRVERVERSGSGVAVSTRSEEGVRRHEGSHLLVATGRTPNSDDLGLDTIGVALDDRGFIVVNDRLETSVPGIWALGDARGGAMFTHTARDDARIVVANVVDGRNLDTRDRVVPYAVFSEPQLGRVGLTERRARSLGMEVEVGTVPVGRVARARAAGEIEGLVKVVVDVAHDRVVGAAALVAHGGEIVQAMTVAISAGISFRQLRESLFTHPTLTEGLSGALGGVHAEVGL